MSMFAGRIRALKSLIPVTLIAAALAFSACGSEEATPASDTSSASDAADASADSSDSGTADTASSDSAADTSGPDTSIADTAVPDAASGKPCADLLPCAMACPTGAERAKCLSDCAKLGSPAAQTDFGALGSCAADLCKDATNTVATNSCIADKCLDKLAKCGEWGGTLGCLDTAQCVSRCSLGDDTCRAKCLSAASKEAASAAAAVVGCAGVKCGGANGAEAYSACVAENCAAPVGVCKGAGLDCTGLFACQAKCPTPVPGKPNACLALCQQFATPDSVAKFQKLAACKESCQGASNKAECIAKDCQPDRVGCFGEGGADICQTINTCVVDKCQGIGGDPKCVAECVAKGKTYDKEAFLTYEGCILQKLEEPEAETLGCSFPYDLNTCIGSLKGCNNQYQGCFKPQ